jgi:hypothetical protein
MQRPGHEAADTCRKNMHNLFEELEAWNPRWREQYRTLWDAAQAAGEQALYYAWIKTEDGRNYERLMYGVPNYSAAIEQTQTAFDRLPSIEEV